VTSIAPLRVWRLRSTRTAAVGARSCRRGS
jgi:hypothetical protein